MISSFPDIAITGDGRVFITYRQFADVRSQQPQDAIAYNVSSDCGKTFSAPHLVTGFEPYDPTDISVQGGSPVNAATPRRRACRGVTLRA